jgi:hypothetical protein
LLKWHLNYGKLKALCNFASLGLRLQGKENKVRCLEENRQQVPVQNWYKMFDQTGCICKGKSQGRRQVTETLCDFCSQLTQINQTCSQTIKRVTHSSAQIVRKTLEFKSYKYKLLKHVIAQGISSFTEDGEIFYN